MEYAFNERGAAQPAPGPDRARPQTSAAAPSANAQWKAAPKDSSPEVKLTSDGQIVEAGYGHGV